MLRTCFSTVPSVTHSRCAMPGWWSSRPDATSEDGQRLRRLGEHTVQIGYEPELFLRLGERGRLGGSAVLVVHSEFDYRLSCPNRCVIVCSMVSAARAGLG